MDIQGTGFDTRPGSLDAADLVRVMIHEVFGPRIALISSFGASSAVLLHMVAETSPATPVLFLDTGKHFGETKRYRDDLVARFGLSDVRLIEPDPLDLEANDPQGVLWSEDPDGCCLIRKVEPLKRALDGFDAWFTGRRADQSTSRQSLSQFEFAEGRIKVNALSSWTQADIDDYFERHDLPRHPLEAEGYLSIGCMTCTDRVAAGEDMRAGRWRNQAKIECGIHTADQIVSATGANP